MRGAWGRGSDRMGCNNRDRVDRLSRGLGKGKIPTRFDTQGDMRGNRPAGDGGWYCFVSCVENVNSAAAVLLPLGDDSRFFNPLCCPPQ
jgi:hypothetical protein